MALSLPYPGQPAANSSLASLPVQANIAALAQAIQAFDGSQIAAGTVIAAALASNINPNTLLHDTIQPFVQSGCVWAQVSGLNGTMTGGTIYVGTSSAIYRVTVNGIGSHTFAASQDTYIDIDYNANVTYSAVANSATSPSLTASSIRIAKVVTGASAITSVVQYGIDAVTANGQVNYIYNQSPYASPIFAFTNTGSWGGSSFYYRNQNGVKEFWGISGGQSITAPGSDYAIALPASFFNVIQTANVSATNLTVTGSQYGSIDITNLASSISSITFRVNSSSNSAAAVAVFVRGM